MIETFDEIELSDEQLENISGGCQGTTLGIVQLSGGLHLGFGGVQQSCSGFGFGGVIVEPQPTLTVVQQPPTVVVPQCQTQLVQLPPTGVGSCQTLTLL